jgi:hypothetical protein
MIVCSPERIVSDQTQDVLNGTVEAGVGEGQKDDGGGGGDRGRRRGGGRGSK